MLVRTYATKNELSIDDVLEALTQCGNQDWKITTKLTASQIRFLNQTFTVGESENQIQLPASKEQLQLPASESDSSQLQTTIPSGDLAEHLQGHSTSLTATDVEALQTTVQTSIIEERAELAAIQDFQTYQATYTDTTRTLVVNDIYQKLDQRNLVRKKFEDQQNQLATQKPNPEKSSDLMSEMLNILKADKYKSEFLTSKLEQI